jgi:excisionase family DNA binding protein
MVGMERIESPLLSTGEAAGLLGVSRQHVVDLCDRGDRIFVRVGSHRRVPRFELDRLLAGVQGRPESQVMSCRSVVRRPIRANTIA